MSALSHLNVHVWDITALPCAAFIILAAKTDAAGGEEACPLPHCEVFWIRRAAPRRDEEVISIYHFLS